MSPSSTGAGPGGSDPSAISIRGLHHWFGEVPALAGLDLEVPVGSTLIVLGPNGSGKSTLTRILATLLRPSRGEVSVLGAALPREAWRVRGDLGYLGHRPLLYGELTGHENLRYHAALFGLEPATAEVRIAELLAATGMERRAERRAAEMSAGMAQRIDICRTVLHGPELLVLDEPDAHLDEAAAAEVAPLIGPAAGRTRIVVTQDIEAGLAGADLALVIDRSGRPHYAGPAAGIGPAEARAAYGHLEPGA